MKRTIILLLTLATSPLAAMKRTFKEIKFTEIKPTNNIQFTKFCPSDFFIKKNKTPKKNLVKNFIPTKKTKKERT